MKKSLLILAALAAAVFVSCNKEIAEKPIQGPEDATGQTPGGELSEFSFAVTRELPATKSFLEDLDFVWEDGEEIAVCYGTSVVKFVYSAASEKFSSSEFDETASGPFYVVAPYSDAITIGADGKVHTELPALQTAGSHGVDSKALISVGKADDVEALSGGVGLKNAFSLVKIGISDTDVNRISIDGNYSGTAISPLLCGPMVVDPADGSATVSGRGTSVSLVPAEGNFAAGDYIVAVAPQTMTGGIKMVFRRDEEAQSYYRNSTKSITFERNKGISFAAVSAAGLSKRCFFVTDAADLKAWAGATKTGDDNIFLGADIDMTDVSWTPVNNFVGTFDGQNHRVHHLSVSGNDYVGFIRINKNDASTAIFKNAVFGTQDGETWDGVSNFTHSSSKNNYTWYYVGVIAKTQQSAVVENVTNFSKIEVAAGCDGKTRAAGICGNWASSMPLKNCYNYGEVVNNASATGVAESGSSTVATSVIGGVVAQCDAAVEISGCENHGAVTNNNPYVKWVAGILASSGKALTVKECINYGTVKNTVNAYTSWVGTGGIVGFLSGADATIDACQTVEASISSVCHVVGGIAAQISKDVIQNCIVSKSQITGNNNFPAGILSYNATAGAVVKGCKVMNSTTIKGKGEIGGIGGRFNAASTIDGCEFTNSTMQATGEDAGGIIGWSQGGMVIKNCKVTNATISSSSNYVSGVAGLAEKTSVLNCSVNNSAISGLNGTGGIVGYAKTVNLTTIKECTVSGASSISGKANVGGVVGWLDAGTLKDCSVTGNVSVIGTADGVGGIVGRAIAKSGNTDIIDGCLAKDIVVQGTYSVGGILGYAYPDKNGPVNIYNCGADSSVQLRATSANEDKAQVGGVCGWARCTDEASSIKVVNCYAHCPIKCDSDLAEPGIGGAIGVCALSSEGTAEIRNFCTALMPDAILVNGSAVTSSTPSCGAVFGDLPDHSGVSVNNCYYITHGLSIGTTGSSPVITDNEAIAEATFKDGSTVPAQLNTFASAYTDYTLKQWTADSAGLPILQ